MPTTSSRPDKPGRLFIDRYMLDATLEEQEAAYENLKSLVSLLVRIDGRLADEEIEMLKVLQPPLF